MLRPSAMDRAAFVANFGGVFEHSPWVAEGTFEKGLDHTLDCAEGLHAAMIAVLRSAPRERKLALINAHPDLAGRLAQAKRLTADSTAEQASAGLDALTADELKRFTALNEAYKARFGFVFIMAVRGRSKAEILAAFEKRLTHSADDEFAEALTQIERIARLRLDAMFAART